VNALLKHNLNITEKKRRLPKGTIPKTEGGGLGGAGTITENKITISAITWVKLPGLSGGVVGGGKERP